MVASRLKEKKAHFRLTSVAQKRRSLSSLLCFSTANGYGKKWLENFPFLPLKAKGFAWYVGSDFIDHHVALFDSIDVKYK